MNYFTRRITAAVLLFACLSVPTAAFADYKVGDVGTIGDVSGSTNIQVGESDSETTVDTGSSDAATESTAAINNKNSSREIDGMFGDLVSVGGQFGIETDSGFVFSENMIVSKDWLKKILDEANYTDGENYSTTRKRKEGIEASESDMSSLRNILGSDKNALEDKGVQLSGSFADFPFSFDQLQGKWPTVYDPTGKISEIIEKWMSQKEGFTIDLGGGLVMVDFDKLSDRYEALQDYLNLKATSITDTLSVQHIMGYGQTTMFGLLLNYKDEEYYRAHRFIQFDTVYEDHGWWKIFAVINLQAGVSELDYMTYQFGTPDEFEDWILLAQSLSYYEADMTVNASDKILTLSTCDRSAGRGGRLIVIARKCR